MAAIIRKNRAYKGFTLAEVLVASLLLTIVMVPILKGLTSAHTLDVKVERRMRSLTLAEAKLEDIKARSIYNYSTDFNDASSPLEGAYLCKVVDSAVSSDLRKILLSVGYDENGNNLLDGAEVEVTLKTLLARRW
ncbi:MAG: type IV pilus modification PilV family protein [Planctomycetota bacterium]|jgi:prepilin-type N-terminal cleavage/methylation domain-containing protein